LRHDRRGNKIVSPSAIFVAIDFAARMRRGAVLPGGTRDHSPGERERFELGSGAALTANGWVSSRRAATMVKSPKT
jgi:hypothetical protein